MTIASRKLASGPATTMAARGPTGWCTKLSLALVGAHGRNGGLIRHARGVLVAEEFHVSAEWNCRELPAGAMPIIEPEQFRAESDRKDQYPHATPAGDQEMAELVEEHHEGENEQEIRPRPNPGC